MNPDAPKVTGIGGVFIKAKNPAALAAWYDENLGFSFGKNSYVIFEWINPPDAKEPGQTVFSIFKQDAANFNPSGKDHMLNLRVSNLEGLLANLRAKGIWVDENMQNIEYGKFGWTMDPEGNKTELWEPADG
jgi:predicted enzyme related to lactoylglutathione lyase